MSHEVVNGVVKVVVRTVPGIQLPRVLKPVLRGKDVEFTDTRAYPLAAKGKFPFKQSFHTVNNITDRAQVKGVITIDRARRAAGGSDATTLRVEGECVVRMGVGISGKVEKIIVDSIRRGYLKLPGIIEEWAAVRHLHLGVREGARSLSRGPVPTAPRAISRTSSADSFKSATSAELSEFGSASSQSALAGGPQGGSGAGGSAGFVPALPPPPATPPEPPRGPSFARGANEGGEAIPLRGSMGAGAGSFADAATPLSTRPWGGRGVVEPVVVRARRGRRDVRTVSRVRESGFVARGVRRAEPADVPAVAGGTGGARDREVWQGVVLRRRRRRRRRLDRRRGEAGG